MFNAESKNLPEDERIFDIGILQMGCPNSNCVRGSVAKSTSEVSLYRNLYKGLFLEENVVLGGWAQKIPMKMTRVDIMGVKTKFPSFSSWYFFGATINQDLENVNLKVPFLRCSG